MRPAQTIVLTLVLTATLNGCAGVGKQDFACPGDPGKPLCLSASEVYRLTESDRLSRPSPRPRMSDVPRIEDELFMEAP
jgi:hypothetical protein